MNDDVVVLYLAGGGAQSPIFLEVIEEVHETEHLIQHKTSLFT